MRIPLSAPDITEAEIEAVSAVLRTNSLSLGPKLGEFEDALAMYHGMPHGIAVSSGTAALHLAIRALGIGEGDEVIVPSFTFIAVANAVVYERAAPVFVDIDPVMLNMDPACVADAITARTRAIIVVHTFGIPAEMDALMELARRNNIAVIEDACEAIGATFNGKLVGNFGDIATLAFYPNKQMTTGEGGAVLVRDEQLARRIRALRNQGRYSSDDWLQHAEVGYNYRLAEMACAMGLAQLGRLTEMLARREEVARNYDALLAPLEREGKIARPALRLPARGISWFVYVLRLAEGYKAADRDAVMQSLLNNGIGCARYFAPIHLQPAYASALSAKRAELAVTESIAQRTLALPFFNRLSQADAKEVVGALERAFAQLS
ncbi:MAG TPA: DegT/DnrJ/EryC1/StrS family aminotransferase [Acidobacteriaceae bacterium]|jgi:perosamine synthetase|nr:DegT/DnrJ/EryC1/StrS family aminotransferase [Acidobacteriaceae bacterium]